ncbi:MAG: hypothetical protein ACRCUH_11880 [Shewanella sp.]
MPSARKYENHGGPGIADIMTILLGYATSEQDRYLFMKSQVLFWLLAATRPCSITHFSGQYNAGEVLTKGYLVVVNKIGHGSTSN